MELELIIWAVLAYTFNFLDGITTHLGMKTPEDIKEKEGNPIAKEMMLKHPRFAAINKFGVFGLLVLGLFYLEELAALIVLAIAFGLVVLNNLYLIIIKRVTKRVHKSPLIILAQFLRIPEKFRYPFVCACIFSITVPVAYLIHPF